MIVITNLRDLPASETQAVIINCGTKWVASLALVSALRNTSAPVLIIDCESGDGSRRHFEQLSARLGLRFAWLEWPLRSHPVALNRLFDEIPADAVLLIDSDLEVRTPHVYRAMQSGLAKDPSAYGAGFLHGPEWLGTEHGLRPYTGYYEERMWIPFVLLRTRAVRRAMAAGFGFMNRRPFFEFASHPRFSRWLGYRYRIRGLRNLPVWIARSQRGNRPLVDGRFPAFVEYDTGADLHAGFKRGGHPFVPLPVELWGDVQHYHGVTRAGLSGPLRRAAKALRLASTDTETEQRKVVTMVRQRLDDIYGVKGISGDE